MAEVTFCGGCNNILYARSNSEKKELVYICRSCDFVAYKRDEKSNVVARINYNYNRKEDVYIHPETKNDPALGRVRDWKCKQCGHEEAVFLQLPEKISYNPMALIYVCTNKKCWYWEKEAQQSMESVIYASDEEPHFSETEESMLFSMNENIMSNIKSEDKKINPEMKENNWHEKVESDESKENILKTSSNEKHYAQPNDIEEDVLISEKKNVKNETKEINQNKEPQIKQENVEDDDEVDSSDVDVEEFFCE